MTIRNIRKNLAGMEDLLQGVGSESQSRGNNLYTIGKIDVPYAVQTEIELKALDISCFTRARIYETATDFEDYIYDPDDLTGIVPTEGAGTWIQVSAKVASSANLALLSADINTVSKYAGKQVWDSTVSRPVWAVGNLAADLWVYADGATAQTPV